MARPRLVVLSGEAGAGKDTVARILVEVHGWRLHSVAGPMKRFAADMFGFTDEQLYGPSRARNEPDPRWARPCDECDSTGSRWVHDGIGSIELEGGCQRCGGEGVINDNSPRRILQLMGEEFLRQMVHVDALTMRARPEIEALLAAGASVVVNDARNDNDRDNLHAWLGACRVDVRTNRKKPVTPADTWRLHASEQRRADDASVEHVIHQGDERWPFPMLSQKVVEMLQALGLSD